MTPDRLRQLARRVAAFALAGVLAIVTHLAAFFTGAPRPLADFLDAAPWIAVAGILQTALAARRERIAAQAAAELRTLKAPDAPAGTCPVCGLADLAERRVANTLLDLAPGERYVVPYGHREAHAECAAIVPYETTPEGRAARAQAEREQAEHRSHLLDDSGPLECALCSRERSRRWSPDRKPLVLRAAVAAGVREVPVEPVDSLDARRGDYAVNAGALSRGEITTVTIVTGRTWTFGDPSGLAFRDPDGAVAHLKHPLAGAYPAGARLIPVSTGWGWNRRFRRPNLPHEAGYPEACECGCRDTPRGPHWLREQLAAAYGVQPALIAEPEGRLRASLASWADLNEEETIAALRKQGPRL